MDELSVIRDETLAAIAAAADPRALDAVRVAALGKSGRVTGQMKTLGALPPDQRKSFGATINALRDEIESALAARKTTLDGAALTARLEAERIDVSLPARPERAGSLHPIGQTIDEICAIFGEMGFVWAEGPDIEDDWHNFTALNIPPDHPARQMQDTFYLPPRADGTPTVLRTHTSPVQARTMLDKGVQKSLAEGKSLRVIVPGRTFRVDSDQTHTPMFHQVEGLVIDRATHMGHLKGCLRDFCRAFFEVDDVPIRFRPSYFPFTEPSAEVDIGCSWKGGELRIGAGDSWLEILGSGMVHPNVLRNCGIDPDIYQGFAFGMGIERVAMLKYGIPDLRTFYDSDLRWLRHYGFSALDVPSLTGGLSR
ncbi:MAG: phenylalanine--tRNA ligase subunit alpha [Rhodospirillales bacterium]|nr:MAG: phenylalanine--tRNA ligase subunit alpha [Rhodospirillales bacterium]